MNYDEEIKWPLIEVEKQKALLLSRRKDLISEMRNEGKSLRSIGKMDRDWETVYTICVG